MPKVREVYLDLSEIELIGEALVNLSNHAEVSDMPDRELEKIMEVSNMIEHFISSAKALDNKKSKDNDRDLEISLSVYRY
jgi:hypothetical protein